MRRQYKHLNTQGRFMGKKNNCQNNSEQKEQDNRRFRITEGNIKK